MEREHKINKVQPKQKKCNKTKTTTKNDEEIVPKKEGNR